MKRLLSKIKNLKSGPVGSVIQARMEEFRTIGSSSGTRVFSELCFCILTANYSAEGGIRIQEKLGDSFSTLHENELAAMLKTYGYRFPNARARYIAENQKHTDSIPAILRSVSSPSEKRQWLVDNILGFGYKEASHFLRNIGYNDLAIIDFHIIDLLAREKMIQKPKSKSLDRKNYLEIERILGALAEKSGISQGELDLYLWYIETGKILK